MTELARYLSNSAVGLEGVYDQSVIYREDMRVFGGKLRNAWKLAKLTVDSDGIVVRCRNSLALQWNSMVLFWLWLRRWFKFYSVRYTNDIRTRLQQADVDDQRYAHLAKASNDQLRRQIYALSTMALKKGTFGVRNELTRKGKVISMLGKKHYKQMSSFFRSGNNSSDSLPMDEFGEGCDMELPYRTQAILGIMSRETINAGVRGAEQFFYSLWRNALKLHYVAERRNLVNHVISVTIDGVVTYVHDDLRIDVLKVTERTLPYDSSALPLRKSIEVLSQVSFCDCVEDNCDCPYRNLTEYVIEGYEGIGDSESIISFKSLIQRLFKEFGENIGAVSLEGIAGTLIQVEEYDHLTNTHHTEGAPQLVLSRQGDHFFVETWGRNVIQWLQGGEQSDIGLVFDLMYLGMFLRHEIPKAEILALAEFEAIGRCAEGPVIYNKVPDIAVLSSPEADNLVRYINARDKDQEGIVIPRSPIFVSMAYVLLIATLFSIGYGIFGFGSATERILNAGALPTITTVLILLFEYGASGQRPVENLMRGRAKLANIGELSDHLGLSGDELSVLVNRGDFQGNVKSGNDCFLLRKVRNPFGICIERGIRERVGTLFTYSLKAEDGEAIRGNQAVKATNTGSVFHFDWDSHEDAHTRFVRATSHEDVWGISVAYVHGEPTDSGSSHIPQNDEQMAETTDSSTHCTTELELKT